MSKPYLTPTPGVGERLLTSNMEGGFFMLNLLRFRSIADYSATPELAPSKEISGKEAYQLYIDHTLPYLRKSGGDISFLGAASGYMIGPEDARWDLVMLIRQKSLEEFSSFASNEEYLAGFGHRQAALEDSRLLPIVEIEDNNITTQLNQDGT